MTDWLIVWCLTPFSIVFQLYRCSQYNYPYFPGVLLTNTLYNILSKPLAAFPHNHCRNNGQQWERNESCRNDYHQSLERIYPEPGIKPVTSSSKVCQLWTKLYMGLRGNPLTKQNFRLLTLSQTSPCFYVSHSLKCNSFENIVWKGEIACNDQFLRFLQCFLLLLTIFCHFHLIWIYRLQAFFSLEKPWIWHLGQG